MRKVAFLVTGCALLLAGCNIKEKKLNEAMLDLGFAEPVAACMSEQLADRMSIGDLLKLNKLTKLRPNPDQPLQLDEFRTLVGTLKDTKLISRSVKSAAVCEVRRIKNTVNEEVTDLKTRAQDGELKARAEEAAKEKLEEKLEEAVEEKAEEMADPGMM